MENIIEGKKAIIGEELDFTLFVNENLNNTNVFTNKILNIMEELRKQNPSLQNGCCIISKNNNFNKQLEQIINDNDNFFTLSKKDQKNIYAKNGIIIFD